MLKNWIFWRTTQIVLDFLLLLLACALAYFMRVGWIFSSDFSFGLFAVLSLLAVLIWQGFLLFTRYYRVPPRSGKRVWFDIWLVLIGGAIANGFLIVTYFFPREILFSRWISVGIFVLGVVFLLSSQWLFRQLLAWQKRSQKQVYKTLIVGANRIALQLIHNIENDKYAPYSIVGVIDPYGLEKQVGKTKVLGKLNKIEGVCKQEGITAIIQCDGFEHTLNLISLAEEKNIKFEFVPALRGIFEENLRLREMAGSTMISFVKRDFTDDKKRTTYRWVDRILRVVFDVD